MIRARLLILLLKALSRFSLPTVDRLARLLHTALHPFPFQFKKTIRTNLARTLPDWNPLDRERLAYRVEYQTILRMLEMPLFWFNTHLTDIHTEVVGEEQFREEYEKGKGMIVLAPHLGAWEMVNCYMGRRYPSVSLYKPIKKAYQETLIRVAREQYGTEMLPATLPGVKRFYEAIKQGKCAGMLPDHDPGENGGVLAPMLGIPAQTTTLIAKIGRKSQAPIYFVFAERLVKGTGFRIHFIKAESRLTDPDLIEAATAMNTGLAQLILQCPEQYEWSYKRYRRTPWNGKGFYE